MPIVDYHYLHCKPILVLWNCTLQSSMVSIQRGHPGSSSAALQWGGNPNSELHDQKLPYATHHFILRGDAYRGE